MPLGTVQDMPSGRAQRLLAVVACAAVVPVAACNSTASVNKNPHTGVGTASSVDGLQVITVHTGVDYRFHPSTLTVHPGRVKIVLINTEKEGAPHNLDVLKDPAANVPLTYAGETQSMTFVAPAPGRYRIECSIHVAQGQTGTLIVLPR